MLTGRDSFPLVITLELFTRLIHSSTVRHVTCQTHTATGLTHVEPIGIVYMPEYGVLKSGNRTLYNQASIFTTLVCNKWVNRLFCGNSKAQ